MDSKGADWVKWILNILIAIIVTMAAGWAKDIRDQQVSNARQLNSIDRRITRIETAMGLIPWKSPVEKDE